MTRKDYELIAASFHAIVERAPVDDTALRDTALELAHRLRQDNPAFSLNTFMRACGWKPVGDARKPVWVHREAGA